MSINLLEKQERQATIDDVLNEVSKMRTAVSEAVDDGVKSALRVVKNGRYATEDAIDDAKHIVRKKPLQAMTVCFSAGLFAGCLLAWAGTRRH